MPNTLTVTDNRTGQTYEMEIENHVDGTTIRASDLRQIKLDNDDFGLMCYDPGFSFSRSPSNILDTGIPVQRDTTSAISSSVTLFRNSLVSVFSPSSDCCAKAATA